MGHQLLMNMDCHVGGVRSIAKDAVITKLAQQFCAYFQ